jgi:septum formation protein
MMDIILASSSPRRKEILARLITIFECQSPPEGKHIRVADAKTTTREKAIYKSVWTALKNPCKLCIGADTLCQIDEVAYGKPIDENNARKMLKKLNSNKVRVFTSVCISHTKKGGRLKKIFWTSESTIAFKKISNGQIENHINNRGWVSKAGGFNILEKPASSWILKIYGEKENVAGLPIKRLKKELQKLKIYE